MCQHVGHGARQIGAKEAIKRGRVICYIHTDAFSNPVKSASWMAFWDAFKPP